MWEFFFRLSRPSKRAISIATDVTCLTVSLWLAFSLRLDHLYQPENIKVLYVLLCSTAVTLYTFVRLGLYRAVIRFMSNQALFAVFVGVSISTVALASFSFVLQAPVPRSVPFIYWCLAMLFVGGSRMLVRSYAHRLATREKKKVVIYGAGPSGMQLALALNQGNEYQPVAFVDDDRRKQGTILQGVKVCAATDLPRLVEKWRVEKVLLAIGSASLAQRKVILRFLETLPVQVQTIPAMSDVVSGKARIEELRDIDIEDLLGRDAVSPDTNLMGACIQDKVVMVTGAGGSIGSELCRQIVKLKPKTLILLEISEYSLYRIERELKLYTQSDSIDTKIVAIVGSVQNQQRLTVIMESFSVQTVYHAAAYKHVPMVEHNVVEGVLNNVFGAWYAAEAAIAAGVEAFVLISTDKAVRPTNIMGASKRMAELVLQGLADRQALTRFCIVRFGNVLGSSGSVVPLFREQIRKGGPVTVTHPDIIRYFMTITEASQLVLQAGSMGSGGEVFVLDMGEQVRIADLARKMIRLMGFDVRDEQHPDGDIEIVYTGLRPGEKLYEELLIGDNPEATFHPRIMKATESLLGWQNLVPILDELDRACARFDCDKVRKLLMAAPTGFAPNHGLQDVVWQQLMKNRSVERGNLVVLDVKNRISVTDV